MRYLTKSKLQSSKKRIRIWIVINVEVMTEDTIKEINRFREIPFLKCYEIRNLDGKIIRQKNPVFFSEKKWISGHRLMIGGMTEEGEVDAMITSKSRAKHPREKITKNKRSSRKLDCQPQTAFQFKFEGFRGSINPYFPITRARTRKQETFENIVLASSVWEFRMVKSLFMFNSSEVKLILD